MGVNLYFLSMLSSSNNAKEVAEFGDKNEGSGIDDIEKGDDS